MKKPSSRNSPGEPTTANLEARFETGRSGLDYFDPARAVLTRAVVHRFEAYARRHKLPHFSPALEASSHCSARVPTRELTKPTTGRADLLHAQKNHFLADRR